MEIKARENKESQSDKQPTRKKSQTNTDSLWNDWDKNQLFKLISRFFHQSKDKAFCVPDESWAHSAGYLKWKNYNFFSWLILTIKSVLSYFSPKELFLKEVMSILTENSLKLNEL